MAGIVVALAVGVAVGAGIVLYLHFEHWSEEKQNRQVQAFSEVDERRAGALAERFRPRLRFDSNESWRPLNIARLLEERDGDHSAHRFCRPGSDCIDIDNDQVFKSEASRTNAAGRPTYIDLAGSSKNEYRGPFRCDGFADCGAGPRSAIYYHVTNSNDRFYIDYWWFLRFNNFYLTAPKASCRKKEFRKNGVCDEHEGDWEGVTAVTQPGDDSQLDYAVYAAHKGAFRYSAAGLGPTGETRPTVYVARGSHASYPRPCDPKLKRRRPRFVCSQPIAVKGLVTLPESTFDGLKPWERNAESCEPNAVGSCLLSLPRADKDPGAWTVWPGLWGSGCGEICGDEPGAASPQSPGVQPRFNTPWCSSQEGVFTCDSRALRCSDWLGPLVAAVACDPQRLAAGLSEPDAIPVADLALKVKGEEKKRATTPGVVQALGEPLTPGETVTISGGGPGRQLLVRAREGRYIVEATFDAVRRGSRSSVAVRIIEGQRGQAPTVRLEDPLLPADDRDPTDLRIVRVRTPE